MVAPVVVAGVLAAGRAVEYTPPHRSPSARAVPPMSEVTRILSAIEHGDPNAAEQLLPLVYDELRKLAAANFPTRNGSHWYRSGSRFLTAITGPTRRSKPGQPQRMTPHLRGLHLERGILHSLPKPPIHPGVLQGRH